MGKFFGRFLKCNRFEEDDLMKNYTAIVERCSETGLYVGYIPGFAGAHTQAESLDELQANLKQVVEMLLEDGEPVFEGEYIGTQTVSL
jgi:predicted RNase H-like HicB family nuclease